MRLDKADQIKSIFLSHDPDAQIFLFGSRVDDDKRGGDIDLLVISDKIDFSTKLKILIKIYDLIGEQKIDIIITKDLTDSFHKHAYNTGIRL